MEKYIAVIMCDMSKIQLIIPEKWYGTLDCNGYNRGINKAVKRRIFFSPFGDDVSPNFELPILQHFQRHVNACYRVYFLQACPTKAECIQYLKSHRVVYPAVYNSRRLLEYIPDPRTIRLDVDANVIRPNVADGNELGPPDDALFAVLNDSQNGNGIEANGRNIVTAILHGPSDSAVLFFGSNATVTQPPIIIDLTMELDGGGTIESEFVPTTTDGAEPMDNISAAAASSVTTSNYSSAALQFGPDCIKREIKAEIYERLLEKNSQNPIVVLTMDTDEAAAFAAVENNFVSDDSDDEFQFVDHLVATNRFQATKIKFDFDGYDILSGDIPFVCNVSIVF